MALVLKAHTYAEQEKPVPGYLQISPVELVRALQTPYLSASNIFELSIK